MLGISYNPETQIRQGRRPRSEIDAHVPERVQLGPAFLARAQVHLDLRAIHIVDVVVEIRDEQVFVYLVTHDDLSTASRSNAPAAVAAPLAPDRAASSPCSTGSRAYRRFPGTSARDTPSARSRYVAPRAAAPSPWPLPHQSPSALR